MQPLTLPPGPTEQGFDLGGSDETLARKLRRYFTEFGDTYRVCARAEACTTTSSTTPTTSSGCCF